MANIKEFSRKPFPSILSKTKRYFSKQSTHRFFLPYIHIIRHTRTVASFSVARSWFLVDANQNRSHNDTLLRFPQDIEREPHSEVLDRLLLWERIP